MSFGPVFQHSLNPSVTLLNWVKIYNAVCTPMPIHRGCAHRHFLHHRKQTHLWESNLRHLRLAGVPVEMLTHYTNPPLWCTFFLCVAYSWYLHPLCTVCTTMAPRVLHFSAVHLLISVDAHIYQQMRKPQSNLGKNSRGYGTYHVGKCNGTENAEIPLRF